MEPVRFPDPLPESAVSDAKTGQSPQVARVYCLDTMFVLAMDPRLLRLLSRLQPRQARPL